MAGSDQIIAAGLDYVFYGAVDDDLIFIGGTGTAPSAGDQDGSPALRWSGAKTAPLQPPEPNYVPVTGDNRRLGTFLFQSTDNIAGIIETAVNDLALQAFAQTTLVESLGSVQIGVLDPGELNLRDVCLIVQGNAKSYENTSRGASEWTGQILPVCNVSPLDRDSYAEQTAATYRYGVVVNPSTKKPWGSVLLDGTNGTTSASILPFTGVPSPLTMHAFTGDGTETTFNLTYEPFSIYDVYVHVEGVEQTYTTDYTVNKTAKTVTFEAGSIPANNARIVVTYNITL